MENVELVGLPETTVGILSRVSLDPLASDTHSDTLRDIRERRPNGRSLDLIKGTSN